jgi:hypothetical protein
LFSFNLRLSCDLFCITHRRLVAQHMQCTEATVDSESR